MKPGGRGRGTAGVNCNLCDRMSEAKKYKTVLEYCIDRTERPGRNGYGKGNVQIPLYPLPCHLFLSSHRSSLAPLPLPEERTVTEQG